MTIWDYLAQNPGWGLVYLLAVTIATALTLSALTFGVQKVVVAARISVECLSEDEE